MVKVEQQYKDGVITNGERYNKVVAIWSEVTERVADEMFKEMQPTRERIAGAEPDSDHGRFGRAR